MKHRCYYSNSINYKNYGGRGITVCDRWLNSFINFLEDMGQRPKGTQLDRINVNGNYTPENCRWASRKQDSRNRRTTTLLTLNGVTKTSVDWSEELGINLQLIGNRHLRGCSDEDCLYKGNLKYKNTTFDKMKGMKIRNE